MIDSACGFGRSLPLVVLHFLFNFGRFPRVPDSQGTAIDSNSDNVLQSSPVL